jgi:hypothetical protein
VTADDVRRPAGERYSDLSYPLLVREIVERFGSTQAFVERAYETPGLDDELYDLDALARRDSRANPLEVSERKLRLAAVWLLDDYTPQTSTRYGTEYEGPLVERVVAAAAERGRLGRTLRDRIAKDEKATPYMVDVVFRLMGERELAPDPEGRKGWLKVGDKVSPTPPFINLHKLEGRPTHKRRSPPRGEDEREPPRIY